VLPSVKNNKKIIIIQAFVKHAMSANLLNLRHREMRKHCIFLTASNFTLETGVTPKILSYVCA